MKKEFNMNEDLKENLPFVNEMPTTAVLQTVAKLIEKWTFPLFRQRIGHRRGIILKLFGPQI